MVPVSREPDPLLAFDAEYVPSNAGPRCWTCCLPAEHRELIDRAYRMGKKDAWVRAFMIQKLKYAEDDATTCKVAAHRRKRHYAKA